MYIYIVQEVEILKDKNVQGLIKGAFTTRKAASLAVKYHKRNVPKEKRDDVLFDIVQVELNSMNMYEKDIEKSLEGLIKDGYMEALIGEDGLFYYELTEKGKKKMKDITGGEEGFDW
tara:strand:- start:57 stop:407 length:351 start_codon:yes stop_codon:yes gene_type:complete